MIKDTKTRVTFVTEHDTLRIIRQLVGREKRAGRKATVSSYIDRVLRLHVQKLLTEDELVHTLAVCTPIED